MKLVILLLITLSLTGCITVWQKAGEHDEYLIPASELKKEGYVKVNNKWVKQ